MSNPHGADNLPELLRRSHGSSRNLPVLLLPHNRRVMLAYSLLHCTDRGSDKVYIPCIYLEHQSDYADTEDLGNQRSGYTLTLSAFYGKAASFRNAACDHRNIPLAIESLSETTKRHIPYSMPYIGAAASPTQLVALARDVYSHSFRRELLPEFRELAQSKRQRGYNVVRERIMEWSMMPSETWFPQYNMTEMWSTYDVAIDESHIYDAMCVLDVITATAFKAKRAECIPVKRSDSLQARVSAATREVEATEAVPKRQTLIEL